MGDGIMDVMLGKRIPVGWQKVHYGVVDDSMLVWCDDVKSYRRPYAGELGRALRQFLSVIRVSR